VRVLRRASDERAIGVRDQGAKLPLDVLPAGPNRCITDREE
jgi:hypothetical protein